MWVALDSLGKVIESGTKLSGNAHHSAFFAVFALKVAIFGFLPYNVGVTAPGKAPVPRVVEQKIHMSNGFAGQRKDPLI